MYCDKSITQYLNDLAARMPAPGGGSAAALAGAMASALMSMVLNFTIGNKKYKNFEGRAKKMFAKSEALRNKFMKFFEEDINSYKAVSAAYKLPKDTEVDKLKRKRAIKEALKQSTLTALHICQHSVEALQLCPELAKSANRNLICDVEAPARLLGAAFYSAKINAVMNLKGIEDEDFNKDIAAQIASSEKELLKNKELAEKEIEKIIGTRINKER